MRWISICSAVLGSLVLLLLWSGQNAAQAMTQAQCKALAATDFSQVPDAPTEVLAANVVAATAVEPAYCRVEGYVSSQVGVEFHLPMENWNGKFIMQGCGGMCGDFRYIESCAEDV